MLWVYKHRLQTVELSLVHLFPPVRVSVQDWSANPLGISGNWFVKWDVSASLEVLPVWLFLSQTSWVQTRGCLQAQRPIFSFFPASDIQPLALTRFANQYRNTTRKYLNFNQGHAKQNHVISIYLPQHICITAQRMQTSSWIFHNTKFRLLCNHTHFKTVL